ncbi:hypothetical protein CFN78_16055 [Amycolatopsis antarctica]|uniref:Squalene cyclase C-terminal domain-containing protein n=1 Tax=Amycolatopsis antarctica TaxID=1854586 RepID=A0A263D147_9PSEU|nr:prenyltransferase/squalene oxidase repeat-containing protein [Amycolatopsis antarctica]OZM72061.1 hypothetical protein CFN78_16055 [Amycolatopsis antarctica]
MGSVTAFSAYRGRIRPRAAVVLAAALLAGGSSVPLAAPAAAEVSGQASGAAVFLERELTRLGHSFPSTTPGTVDGGLVADTLIGLHAAGRTGETFSATTDKLRGTYYSATVRTSGLTAKYLMVARRAGVDPAEWGVDSAKQPVDLVARLAGTLDEGGRYRNLNAGPYDPKRDLSNVFSQSLALIAMHEQNPGAGQEAAIRYLVRQQCPGGGFRAAPPSADVGSTCTSAEANGGVDYTAMAVWALAETGGDPAALHEGLDWLRANQQDDGGFVAEGASNANSTGLAALALTKAGERDAAGRAAGWMASVQAPADSAEPAVTGAVAYNAEKYLEMTRDPAAFWSGTSRQDQLRRATAQAVLGLSATPPTDIPAPPTDGDGGTPGPAPGGTPPPGGDGAEVTPETRTAALDAASVSTAAATAAVTAAANRAAAGAAVAAPPPAAPPTVPAPGMPAERAPGGVESVGRADPLPAADGGFGAFLRGPWGIASSVLLGFAVAGAGYFLAVRRPGGRG